ncbi:MAG: FG-GAP repeat protein [Phycisphaerae bacterium]
MMTRRISRVVGLTVVLAGLVGGARSVLAGQVFWEDFGADLSQWNVWSTDGSYSVGITGAEGNPPPCLSVDDFLTSGAGVISKQAFAYAGQAMTFSVDMKDGQAALASQRYASFVLTKGGGQVGPNAQIATITTRPSNHSPTPNGVDFSLTYDDNGTDMVESSGILYPAGFAGESWHSAAISIRPDGIVDFLINGNIEYTSTHPITPAYSGLSEIALGTRKSYYDNVSVTSAQCSPGETAKLLAPDGLADDGFGHSVDICGDLAVVGKPQNGTPSGTGPGAAYVFEKIGGTWVHMATLTASDGVTNDQFGYGVACSGDTILVGAIYDEDNGWHSGSAYIFEKPAGGWSDMTETVKLVPSDGFARQTFGFQLDLWGDTAVIGGPAHDTASTGAAYVFVRPSGGWPSVSSPMFETAKLTASDGVANDRGGSSVAVSGDWIMLGAVYDSDGGFRSGSTYVFEKPPTGWAGVMTENQKLTASDATPDAIFGHSLSIDGATAVIGAVQDNTTGAAYVFEQSSGTWAQSAKLTPSDGAANDYFGNSVSISGDIVVVGAVWINPGYACVFQKPATGWGDMTETARLVASDSDPTDRFGYDVAVSDSTALVGALADDDNGTDSGSVYVFDGFADCNSNGALDSCDIADGTSTDCNGNGVPDECDIADGSSADCNANGIPDECEDVVDTTPPDVTCSVIPVPEDESDDSGDESNDDSAGDAPFDTAGALAGTPSTDAVPGSGKAGGQPASAGGGLSGLPGGSDAVSENHHEEDDLLMIVFEASDDCGAVDVSAVIDIGCMLIPVENGTVIDLECREDCEAEAEHGVLEIEAATAVLIVTAIDESGNVATCEVVLCDPPDDSGDGDDSGADDANAQGNHSVLPPNPSSADRPSNVVMRPVR